MTTRSRRDFLGTVGGASIAGLAAPAWTLPRTVEAATSDYLFAGGIVYLNTGALGATPRPVMEKTVQAWHELEGNPAGLGYGSLEAAAEAVRAKGAKLLGCSVDELMITNSTSDGMNTVAQGLTLSTGQRVLTTDQEHPGGRVCWDYCARKFGAVVDTIPIRPGDTIRAIVDRFAAAITARTRVITVSHVLTSTGFRMPIAEISALARSRNCLVVVDGAQAAGAIRVDVKALGCHAYATSGHKWIQGPKGTGLLYLRADARGAIDPIALQGGREAYTASSGVRNLPGLIGLGAAIDYLDATGFSLVEAHGLALRSRLLEGLRQLPQVTVVSPPAGPSASAILTFALPGNVESNAFATTLRDKHRLIVKSVPKEWHNGLRISTHICNTEPDVDALLRALKAELA